MRRVLFAVATAIGVCVGGAAFAVPLQWTISGVSFDDGGEVTADKASIFYDVRAVRGGPVASVETVGLVAR